MKVFLIRLLLVIVVLLVIIYSIFPYFIINLFGLVNSTKNKESIDVVIAHYKEDLKWVDNLPDNCRIFIYTKSDQKPNCKRQYFHEYLPTLGRCDATYLYHVIKNYHRPHNENILFLPGSCDIFYKQFSLYLLLHNTGKHDFNNCITTNNVIFKSINDMRLNYFIKNGYCSSHKSNQHKDCTLIVSKFKNVNEFKQYFDLNLDYVTYWGMNMIKSKLIYNRSKEFYVQLYNTLNDGDNVLNGHFTERSWYSIFTCR